MYIFIGIDPSMNSTGIVVQFYEDNKKIKEQFYIIKPDKLTKKEQKAQDTYLFFDYIVYEKYDLKKYENNHEHELYKTLNMIKVVDIIKNIVMNISKIETNIVYIVQEGISYGSSIRTKSVFDLAGLNYMIRYVLNKCSNVNFVIATPSEIKKWVTGSGNCNKEIIIDMFKSLYPNFDIPKLDDISDAYFMAMYAKKIFEDNNNL